jgi:hypothetical protein
MPVESSRRLRQQLDTMKQKSHELMSVYYWRLSFMCFEVIPERDKLKIAHRFFKELLSEIFQKIIEHTDEELEDMVVSAKKNSRNNGIGTQVSPCCSCSQKKMLFVK